MCGQPCGVFLSGEELDVSEGSGVVRVCLTLWRLQSISCTMHTPCGCLIGMGSEWSAMFRSKEVGLWTALCASSRKVWSWGREVIEALLIMQGRRLEDIVKVH